MPNKFLAAIGGLVTLYVLNVSGAISWAANQLLAPLAPRQDDMLYAQRVAEKINDTPNCARFKQAILEAGKGPSATASTKANIINAYEEGKKNGCRTLQP